MATSSSGLRDEATAELGPAGPEPDYGPQADPIPARPSDGAGKDSWVGYVVALGADRTYVTTTTAHFDGEDYGEHAGLTKEQLIDLADRLGG